MDIAEYKRLRKLECEKLEAIKDPVKRIDKTYKAMEKYSRLRHGKGWVINEQPFAQIVVKAFNELNNVKEVEYE